MRRNSIFAFILYIAILCVPLYVEAQSSPVPPGYREEGNASWYGEEFSGRPTASGEIFNPSLFTAAHPTLPFGTFLFVTNKNNNRQVTVKVNDRGPFVASRIIDLSKAAAEHLDMINSGIAPVIIETLSTTYSQPPEPPVISTPAPIQPPPQPSPVPQPPAIAPAPAVVQPAPVAPQPVPEPVRTPEPAALAPLAPPIPSETPSPNALPYPPITVNVYPSAQPQAQVPPPLPPAQLQPQVPPLPPPAQFLPQAQPQYAPPLPPAQLQPQVPPLPPAQFQPQVQPQYAQPQYAPPPPPVQFQPQAQPQYVPPPPPAQFQPQAQPQYAQPQMLPPLEPVPPPALKLIPAINPLPGSLYKIQVGSYKVPRHAVDAFDKLKGAGLNPSYEPNGEFYRVVLAKIPGIEVQSVADKLARAGFHEALIREER